MKELLEIFKMEEVSVAARIRLLKKFGRKINDENSANLTEEVVYELVLLLDPDDPIKEDKHYLSFVKP